eukprot:CAMPEP_0113877648 /NCGR_PEP_ID=MMETSP0780_2-20120614/6220_1 /TAXON_ID=652834 /ORGANISM="Palpitomonas bilix" /LENGTH=338 /DNA_ID=CAMNT_0000863983 /DNA_START=57 /DNA_END=1070 /DNA_ORIENTATION=+ /assembly_acc=CAM_ASM_000599
MRSEVLLLAREVLEYYGFSESVSAFDAEYSRKEQAMATLSAGSLAERASEFMKEAPQALTLSGVDESADALSQDDPLYWCRHPDRLFAHFMAAFDERRHSDLFSLSELFLSHKLLEYDDGLMSSMDRLEANNAEIEKAVVLRYFLHIFFATRQEESPSARSMNHWNAKLKTFMEGDGSSASHSEELITYYALPFIPNAKDHPSFSSIFEPEWEESLRHRLISSLPPLLLPRLLDVFELSLQLHAQGEFVLAPSSSDPVYMLTEDLLASVETMANCAKMDEKWLSEARDQFEDIKESREFLDDVKSSIQEAVDRLQLSVLESEANEMKLRLLSSKQSGH